MVSHARFFADCPKENHFHEMGEPAKVTVQPARVSYQKPVRRGDKSRVVSSYAAEMAV